MDIKKITPAIPRAIYYMSPKTAVNSLFKILLAKPTFNKVALFENKFASFVDCPYAIATSHARIALYLTLRAYEFPEESEVLLTGINLPDMINMIRLNGLKPVCIDYQASVFDISIEDIENKITPHTRVMFITLLAGIIPNLNELYELAKKHNLVVIQDLTQAFYLKVNGRDVASLSDVSIYSLCDLKDIHTHRGGMIVTKDRQLYDKLLMVRNNESLAPSKKYFIQFILEDLMSSVILRRRFFDALIFPILKGLYKSNKIDAIIDLTKGKGFKVGSINIGRGLWGGDGDLIRHDIPGKLKYTYTDLQAEIGLKELDKVVIRIEKRKELAKRLAKKINPDLIPFDLEKDHSFWKFPIRVKDIGKFQKKLLELGGDSAPTNLPNLSTLECFKDILNDDLKNTSYLIDNILYIPVHYYLTPNEVDAMADIINSI